MFAFVTKQAAAKRAGKRSTEFEITIGHAGDCRAVLLRNDGSFESLTRDHVPTDQGERERIEAAGGKVQGGRINDGLNFSRVIGAAKLKANRKLPAEQPLAIALPDVTTVSASEGDVLLLASDGLVEDEKLRSSDEEKPNAKLVQRFRAALAKSPDDPARALSSLLDQTLAAKSKDNLTAVCVQLGVPHDEKLPAIELIPSQTVSLAAFDQQYRAALKRFLESSGVDQAERIRVVEQSLANELEAAKARDFVNNKQPRELDVKIKARETAPDPEIQVFCSLLHCCALSDV